MNTSAAAPAPRRQGARTPSTPSDFTSRQPNGRKPSGYGLPSHVEQRLAARIQRGDIAARNELVNANLGLVIKFAERYQGCGLPLDDLVQAGNLGLIDAAERFRPLKFGRFSTYAIWWVRRAINAAVAEELPTVRLPAWVRAAGDAQEYELRVSALDFDPVAPSDPPPARASDQTRSEAARLLGSLGKAQRRALAEWYGITRSGLRNDRLYYRARKAINRLRASCGDQLTAQATAKEGSHDHADD